MARAPAGARRRSILKDPDVDSLSSFIGVDGSNVTLNSGRFLINLKPHARAHRDRQRGHPPPAAGDRRRRRHRAVHAAGAGSLDRHRGQRHAISVHARQPGSADAADLDAESVGAARQDPRDRRRRERSAAERPLGRWSTIDRATAARFGITPATVDNALYDAFGQRIISTIFTQSNQYRVILDIDPAMTAFGRRR